MSVAGLVTAVLQIVISMANWKYAN